MILPSELFTHFEIIDVVDGAKEIQLFLDEKFVPPAADGDSSKGFTEQSVIQDFPLIGKAVFCIFADENG